MFRYDILLGFDTDNRCFYTGEERIYALIFGAIWTCWIEESEDYISIMERVICFGIYPFIYIIGFLTTILFSGMMMDARSIEKYDL